MLFAVNTSHVEPPTRNAGARGGGKFRPVPQLGSTAGGCPSSSTRAQGQVHTRRGACSVQLVSAADRSSAPRMGRRSRASAAAATPALRAPAPAFAEASSLSRAAVHSRWCLELARRKRRMHEELAADSAERLRIAEAQAAERARVDSNIADLQRRNAMVQVKLARHEQHQLARNAARLARVEAVRKAEAAAVEARDRDVAAMQAAERAVDERHLEWPQLPRRRDTDSSPAGSQPPLTGSPRSSSSSHSSHSSSPSN